MQNAKTIIKQLVDSVKLAESEKRQTIPLVAVKSIVELREGIAEGAKLTSDIDLYISKPHSAQ